VNNNSRPWREEVGGLWEEVGKLQFNFMVEQGLKPNHHLLDIGCGSLRGGIHFINYLDVEHYYGIDKNKDLLDGGKFELESANLSFKKPILKQISHFNFSDLKQNFEFAIALSVFTHLPSQDIENCLINTENVLKKGSRFFATFFENSKGEQYSDSISHHRIDGQDIITFPDKDPYHYSFETIERLTQKTHLEVKYIGDWNHPRNQKMIFFIKK